MFPACDQARCLATAFSCLPLCRPALLTTKTRMAFQLYTKTVKFYVKSKTLLTTLCAFKLPRKALFSD